MMNRRYFLSKLGLYGASLGASSVVSQSVLAQSKPLQVAGLRGSLNATDYGVRPDAYDDQSTLLQSVVDKAAKEDRPVFLPPGVYVISNLNLPPRTRLMGISGTSRIIYGGGGALLSGIGCELIEISGLTFDGANRPIGDPFGGLIYARGCPRVLLDNCDFIGSQGTGLTLEGCGGRVERCRISGAAGLAALYSVNATGLAIDSNTVEDCANGGILVHRWKVGEDGTMVTNNRIERISAKGGGTGQRGNGINLFRTNGAIVANNHISDCAFSAVRANSASNLQVIGNTALRSGETALYAEFAFEGSLISNNIVDGGTIGVSITNFNEGGRLAICSNNLIRNISNKGPYRAEFAGFGIGIYAEAETSITGNVVEGAPQYGLCLGWGPYLRNVIASNNILRNTGEGIAVSVVKGAGSALITNNLIDTAKNGGIIGHEWTKSVTRDLSRLSKTPYSHLALQGNIVR